MDTGSKKYKNKVVEVQNLLAYLRLVIGDKNLPNDK